jgi:hypothetical protein
MPSKQVQCVRKVAVHLQNMLEVISTGLNPFNFIRKHFPQVYVRKVAVHLIKGVASDVPERRYRPEPIPYRSLSAQDFPNALCNCSKISPTHQKMPVVHGHFAAELLLLFTPLTKMLYFSYLQFVSLLPDALPKLR